MNLIHALGWTLIHFLWEGALIALVLALALNAFRASSARLRYGLACLAMMAMLAAFGGTLERLWPASAVVVRDYPARVPTLVPPPAPAGAGDIPTNAGDARLWWLVLVWMLGVCGFTLQSLVSWAAARRLRRTGVCFAPEAWQRKLRRLADDLGLSTPLTLFESALAEVPVVIGVLRPVILVPAGLLAKFPPEQLEYFLVHELAHIRRCDYLVNLLQSFAEDLLFYHPAVWWVSRMIRAERENCCDDVVRARGNAREYAAALVALEQNRGIGREAVLAANGGQLMQRIQRLAGRENPRSAGGLVTVGLLIASAVIAIAAVRTQSAPVSPHAVVVLGTPAPLPAPIQFKPPRVLLTQAQNNSPKPAPPADGSPQVDAFQKWLNEDVVYIITQAERSAFLRLNTDQEREQFIEQFWLRRDPTPGTIENEYKEEHYRRIAYANESFGASVSGWQTDRGRIYITFGPPDEIDSHPSGGTYERPAAEGGGKATTLPFEDWLYHYLQGIGNDVKIEFVDTTRTGDYRMTMDPSEKDAVYVPGDQK